MFFIIICVIITKLSESEKNTKKELSLYGLSLRKDTYLMVVPKKAVTINDISGMGRCSVTVACPILSASGIETSVLPTALLSTHTGGFDGFSFLDLTDEMNKIIKHWETLDISFDAIYSGYLGSLSQIETVDTFINKFKKENTIVIVDPVMGDAGKFYSGFTTEYINGMRKLCSKADIIVPNITEALFLLDEPFTDGPYTIDYIKSLIKKIADIGSKKIVLTGVHFDDIEVGAASYDSETDTFSIHLAPKVEGFYHGTGDVFASVLLSSVLNGFDLGKATENAVKFTHGAIVRTKKANTDTRYGVLFEQEVPNLIKILGL